MGPAPPAAPQLPIPDRRYTTNRALAANFRLPTFLYTGDSAADADAVANGLFPTPVISAAPGNSALYARMFSYLGQQNNDDPTTLYGEIFTMLGLPLGSATVASNVLLLENAFYKTDVRYKACFGPRLLCKQMVCLYWCCLHRRPAMGCLLERTSSPHNTTACTLLSYVLTYTIYIPPRSTSRSCWCHRPRARRRTARRTSRTKP